MKLQFKVILPTENIPLILNLIPEAAKPSDWSRIIIAVNTENSILQGACLIDQRGHLKRHYVLIRTVNKQDDEKITQALIKEVIKLAFQMGIYRLYYWETFSSCEGDIKKYLNTGFVISERAIYYEVSVNHVLDDLEPLYNKLRSKNKIPKQVLEKRFSKNNLAAIHALHVAEFECDPIIARQRLLGKSDDYNYCPVMSTVLILDEEVIGVFLVYPDNTPRTVFVYGIVVDKKWRGRWANAYLKYSSFQHLRTFNINRVRFRAIETCRDTNKHAMRAQAKIIEESFQLSYSIDSLNKI